MLTAVYIFSFVFQIFDIEVVCVHMNALITNI